MPLYEYECAACHQRFERIQRFSDPSVDVCPNCGKGPVKKLLSSPAIQFKGSGWYITDYARKSSEPTKTGSSDTAAAGSPPASDSTKSPAAEGGKKSAADKTEKKD